MLDVDLIYQNLRNDLQKLESERIVRLGRIYPFKVFFQICMIVVLASSIHMIFFDGFSNKVLSLTIVIFVVGIIVYAIKYGIESSRFKIQFQKEIVAQIIPMLGPDFSYQPDGIIDENDLKQTLLFHYFNQYKCEDLVTGKIGNKLVRYAEVKLQKVTRRSGSRGKSSQTTTTPVFSGIFLTIELESSFPSPFWILPNKKWSYHPTEGKGELVNLDHETFHENYKVYSHDPDTSRKLLIAPILDSLLDLNERLKSNKIITSDIYFSFMDNKISIAIPTTKGFMEPNISQPINSKAYIEEQLVFLNGIHQLGERIG